MFLHKPHCEPWVLVTMSLHPTLGCWGKSWEFECPTFVGEEPDPMYSHRGWGGRSVSHPAVALVASSPGGGVTHGG